MRARAYSIFRSHRAEGDPDLNELVDSTGQEANGRRLLLVGNDLNFGRAFVVVDGDVHRLLASSK